MMNIVFAGGGTGGHLTPGLAVAEAICRRGPQSRIVFVGTNRPLERQLIPARFEHCDLPVESSQTLRRNPVRFLFGNMRAFRQATALLKRDPPDAVVGLGGFASAPVVVAASWLRIPVTLHEQNVIAGRSTRWLSRFATRVCVSFDGTRPRLRAAEVRVTGNPVRAEITELAGLPDRPVGSPPVVLVLGGSQGARPINEALMHAAESGWLCDLHIVHQTGPDDLARVREVYSRRAISHDVEPFFSDMADRYRSADVVVSRAGATTLAEIACAGIPAVLIPYPHAADDHQWHNALAFSDKGAARLVRQTADPGLFGQALVEAVREYLANPEIRSRARETLCQIRRPDAADRVAELVLTFRG